MAFDTLGSPPPFFHQGAPKFARLLVFLALSVLLMVADARWPVTQIIHQALHIVLTPVQWALNKPLDLMNLAIEYGRGLHEARSKNLKQQQQLLQHAATSTRYRNLLLENARLKNLLNLKSHYLPSDSQVAQILQENADPFSHKILLNKGQFSGVVAGSPVLDTHGLIGQVTRVFLFSSEVTLVDDPSFMIPVINTRTGSRSLAFGSSDNSQGNLELRFNIGSADIQVDDVLTTSGIDSVYPPGLEVARVVKINHKATASFSRVYLQSLGQSGRGRYVLILAPQPDPLPFGQASTVPASAAVPES